MMTPQELRIGIKSFQAKLRINSNHEDLVELMRLQRELKKSNKINVAQSEEPRRFPAELGFIPVDFWDDALSCGGYGVEL